MALWSTGTISPRIDGSTTQQSIEAIGTAENIPFSHELWLFVRPTGGTIYLPVDAVRGGEDTFAIHVDADGSWYQQDVEFGAQEDGSGGEFELISLASDRTAQVIIAGHAFVQNLRRGHYEIAVEVPRAERVTTAFVELAPAI